MGSHHRLCDGPLRPLNWLWRYLWSLALFGELAGFYAIAWRLHLAITTLCAWYSLGGRGSGDCRADSATGGYVSRTKGGFARLLGMSTLGQTFIGGGLFCCWP